MTRSILSLAALAAVMVLLTGFDTRNALVPPGDILSGGPPKDGIPALVDPAFVAADAADHIRPDDQVIGVAVNGQARAYPIKILNWHEAVNDTVGGQPLVATF